MDRSEYDRAMSDFHSIIIRRLWVRRRQTLADFKHILADFARLLTDFGIPSQTLADSHRLSQTLELVSASDRPQPKILPDRPLLPSVRALRQVGVPEFKILDS